MLVHTMENRFEDLNLDCYSYCFQSQFYGRYHVTVKHNSGAIEIDKKHQMHTTKVFESEMKVMDCFTDVIKNVDVTVFSLRDNFPLFLRLESAYLDDSFS